MNSSLDVIRDQNGYFRHADGYPLVVIFDSKHGKNKRSNEISWQEPVIGLHTSRSEDDKDNDNAQSKKETTHRRPLKFVSMSRPVIGDKRSKRFTRTPVIAAGIPQERKEKSSVSKTLSMEPASARNITLTKKTPRPNSAEPSIPWQPFVLIDPFINFPVNLEPYMCTLLDQYISITSTSVKTPGSCCGEDLPGNGWLSLAMTDAALFHSILCGSALYTDIVLRRGESLAKIKHMKETIRLLNKRLQEPEFEISDGTIITVAHLAEYEASASAYGNLEYLLTSDNNRQCIVGNFKNWNLHMDGLYKMVEIRGGFLKLTDSVKNKVLRVDVVGCIGTLSKPRFTTFNAPSLSLPESSTKSHILPLCDGLKNVTELFILDDSIIGILRELQYLTSMIKNETMDLIAFDGIAVSIQYHLLLFQFISHKSSQHTALEDACCMGALIYLKTIHHYRLSFQIEGYPFRVSTDGAIIQKLKSCLDIMETNTRQTKELFIWILFLGGGAATSTRDRTWFVARLGKALMEWQVCSWEDAKSLLMKFLWVEAIHADSGRDLWDEAQITVSVLFGS
ncbi:hypothetical protein B7463_g7088, partial [Scytalidium lignicola]